MLKLPNSHKALVAASTRPLILAVLGRGESYGYALIEEVRRLSGGALEWKDGMLYPVLARLSREGLVESRWAVAEAGPRRRYYSLSEAGREALLIERAQWRRIDRTLRRAWGALEC